MADALSKEAIERLRVWLVRHGFDEISETILALLDERDRRSEESDAAFVAARRGFDAASAALTDLRAEIDRLTRENAALRDVAEKFRAWTEEKPHTVEESDALHEACESLGSYDAWKAVTRE